MADGIGFEPMEPCGSLPFQDSAIDHSANHPIWMYQCLFGVWFWWWTWSSMMEVPVSLETYNSLSLWVFCSSNYGGWGGSRTHTTLISPNCFQNSGHRPLACPSEFVLRIHHTISKSFLNQVCLCITVQWFCRVRFLSLVWSYLYLPY